MALQVRMAVQSEVLGRLFAAVLKQQPDRLHGQCSYYQRPIHRFGQFFQFARLQEPQHLDEFASARLSQFAFQPPS